ncbi:hypothetical protein [Leifsonia sp. EB34]|uniref:hypothetical protein n=1 Tax=Leifsonia sp. EB34 TaxID=3156303 RepID=UPI0035168AD9
MKPLSMFQRKRMLFISSLASFAAAALVLLLIPELPAPRPPLVPFFIAAAILAAWGVTAAILAGRSRQS